ncbi:MAG: DUF89 domain-containing protein [Anaerolineaceae bacterium]
MKLQLNCGSCMVKQALAAMDTHGVDSTTQIEILEKIIADIPEFLTQPTPGHFQTILLRKLSDYLKIEDIYLEDRKKQNARALQLLPLVEKRIRNSDRPLYTAALAVVEGNMIDQLFFSGYDLQSALHNNAEQMFAVDHFDTFTTKLSAAGNIFYITDNAGEIVFDKFFIETCQKWRISTGLQPAAFTVVVKSGPVLNDATLEDALSIQLDSVAQVIESGSSFLGLPLEHSSEQVQHLLSAADLIISKGQANFETLEDNRDLYGRIFFLLKTKCLHLSGYFKVPEGSGIFYHPG